MLPWQFITGTFYVLLKTFELAVISYHTKRKLNKVKWKLLESLTWGLQYSSSQLKIQAERVSKLVTVTDALKDRNCVSMICRNWWERQICFKKIYIMPSFNKISHGVIIQNEITTARLSHVTIYKVHVCSSKNQFKHHISHVPNLMQMCKNKRLFSSVLNSAHKKCDAWTGPNFWVCRQNALVWPLKWNLLSRTFAWYYMYLLFSILSQLKLFLLESFCTIWDLKWLTCR